MPHAQVSTKKGKRTLTECFLLYIISFVVLCTQEHTWVAVFCCSEQRIHTVINFPCYRDCHFHLPLWDCRPSSDPWLKPLPWTELTNARPDWEEERFIFTLVERWFKGFDPGLAEDYRTDINVDPFLKILDGQTEGLKRIKMIGLVSQEEHKGLGLRSKRGEKEKKETEVR